MLCYHEEYFTLGFLSAFFIIAIITLFEEPLVRMLKRIQNNLKVGA